MRLSVIVAAALTSSVCAQQFDDQTATLFPSPGTEEYTNQLIPTTKESDTSANSACPHPLPVPLCFRNVPTSTGLRGVFSVAGAV